MRVLPICLLAAVGLAETPAGIRPRPAIVDYPARAEADGIKLGAALLPAEQVKRMFATDLSPGYVVVEVALYPEQEIEVSRDDFVLRAGAGQTVRPASPSAIAASIQRSNTPRSKDSDITVYPSVGVVYSTGPDIYGRRTGGVGTTAGVGVGVGGPGGPPSRAPGSTDADRRVMQTELEEKSLPTQATAKPVAGYLYFPVTTTKGKSVVYELEYYGGKRKIRARLP